jgi:UDP-glucuronate 4-epimerase
MVQACWRATVRVRVQNGIRIVGLRLFTVYGPRQRPDLAIHKFARAILQGEPVSIYGHGNSLRDYTYIDDVVEAICSASEYDRTDFDVFNIGCGSPVSVLELIQHIERSAGVPVRVLHRASQAGDVVATHADIRKARALLGYQPSVALPEGLTGFFKWLSQDAAAAGCWCLPGANHRTGKMGLDEPSLNRRYEVGPNLL